MKISYAPKAWKLLNGIFCVYKPSGVKIPHLKNAIIFNLCRDLNQLECRPPSMHVKIEDDPTSATGLTVSNTVSLADHPLVVGQRYQIKDIELTGTTYQGTYTSGLCVLGINAGSLPHRLREGQLLKVFQLCGRFGLATDDFHVDSKIIQKTTYGHITRHGLDRILSSIQAGHQRQMYNYAGVDIKSQTAFELASKGPIRPAKDSPPLLYSIRCIDFALPNFVLEIQCINENEGYLMNLVHEIGLQLRSTAACATIRQIRFGPYDLSLALLRKNWTLEHVINNITYCRRHVGRPAHLLVPSSPNFVPVADAADESNLKRLPPVS